VPAGHGLSCWRRRHDAWWVVAVVVAVVEVVGVVVVGVVDVGLVVAVVVVVVGVDVGLVIGVVLVVPSAAARARAAHSSVAVRHVAQVRALAAGIGAARAIVRRRT